MRPATLVTLTIAAAALAFSMLTQLAAAYELLDGETLRDTSGHTVATKHELRVAVHHMNRQTPDPSTDINNAAQ